MDRVISLLAALVGLIALGGAILVHTNADQGQHQIATELAQLKAGLVLTGQRPAETPPITAPVEQPRDDGTAAALLALQDRIAALEQLTRQQASDLDAARTQLAAAAAAASQAPAASSSEVQVAALPDAAPPAPSGAPAATAQGGPTTDCIPLGTRFMAQTGDDFPICKTKVVVKVASVSDGLALIEGAGEVAAGGVGTLGTPGCSVSVFSADSSGFAEMRVTCQ